MAEGGAAPPAAAMRGKGVSSVIVIVVAVITFLAGLGVGSVFLGARAPPAKTILVVAVQVPFPPFADFNKTSGEFEGFEMDIVKLIAAELNLTPVYRQFSNFPALLAETGTGGVDMASASITITAARNATMDFSDTYYIADQGVLVQSSSTLVCPSNDCTNSPQTLKDSIIGVQQGTTSFIWVNSTVKPLMSDPANQIKVFAQVPEVLTALRQGVVDVVIMDLPVVTAYANAPSSGLKVVGKILTNELYGFAVANNDPQGLVPVINAVLSRIRASGDYDDLITKWFA